MIHLFQVFHLLGRPPNRELQGEWRVSEPRRSVASKGLPAPWIPLPKELNWFPSLSGSEMGSNRTQPTISDPACSPTSLTSDFFFN